MLKGKQLKELFDIAREAKEYGKREDELLRSVEAKSCPVRVRPSFSRQRTPEEKERFEKLLNTSYGLPSNPLNVPKRFLG